MSELLKKIQDIFGDNVKIASDLPAAGGCINKASVLTLTNGEKVFVKRNRSDSRKMFDVEKSGLELLCAGEGPRVPEPLASLEDDRGACLLLEYIEPGRRTSDYMERLGRELSAMHRTVRQEKWGLAYDNYIGSTPQFNREYDSWIEFFAECRLGPQMDMARKAGLADKGMVSRIEKVTARLDSLLIEPDEKPTVIHGDLWTGNVMTGSLGEPVIIDPAVYFGHREADLAMTELFGRLERGFYDAYNEAWPLEPGYDERKDLYNLYHMLNHLNIFGGGYAQSVKSIAGRYS